MSRHHVGYKGLRRGLHAGPALAADAGSTAPKSTQYAAPDRIALDARPNSMPPTARNLRLDDALALPGCPVCRMVVQRVAQTMESIQDELVLDPTYREQLDAAWGFCTVHAQQWLDAAPPLSTAIIYEAVLGRISRDLERGGPGRSRRGGQLRTRLRGGKAWGVLIESRVCPLCLARDEQERQIVAHLVEELGSEAFRHRYLASDGLCVPHLNLALCAGPDPGGIAVLRDRLLQTHEALRGQLREVIRKHDYRYRDEAAGPEWDAVVQAVRHVAGASGIDGRRARPPIVE